MSAPDYDNSSQPEWGTERYKRQVDTIYTQFTTSSLEQEHLSSFLMMFIMDKSYNRAAICEAEKKILKEKGWTRA